MPVYMIIDIKAKDPGTYAEYMEKVPATVYGGRYLVNSQPRGVASWLVDCVPPHRADAR